MKTEANSFTVVLETTEPFGPEVQVMQETAHDGREAALRALYDWHNRDFDPTTTIAELENDSVRVLVVLEGHAAPVLTRTPARKLA